MTELVQIVTAALGTLGFGILFNVRGKKLAAVTAAGGISWALFIALCALGASEVTAYLICAIAVSVFAEVMARVLKSPATVFITPSLIPFIPGSSLYYSLAYAFSKDYVHFAEKALSTLSLASALAIGVISASAITSLVLKLVKRRNEN